MVETQDYRRFSKFYTQTMLFEGASSNHSYDPGRETMYGLSARYNPSLSSKIVGGTLTKLGAYSYVYNRYYKKYNIDAIGDARLAFIMFDAIFSGQVRPVLRSIQSSLNALLVGKKEGLPPLKVDGLIGRKTIRRMNLADESQIQLVLRILESNAGSIGKALSDGIIKRQKKNGLPWLDLSRGLTNRLTGRLAFAKSQPASIGEYVNV